MNKNILKNIAKEWAKGILLSTEGVSFDEEFEDLLSTDEEHYIINEVHKIAERITKEDYTPSLVDIVKKYYELE